MKLKKVNKNNSQNLYMFNVVLWDYFGLGSFDNEIKRGTERNKVRNYFFFDVLKLLYSLTWASTIYTSFYTIYNSTYYLQKSYRFI